MEKTLPIKSYLSFILNKKLSLEKKKNSLFLIQNDLHKLNSNRQEKYKSNPITKNKLIFSKYFQKTFNYYIQMNKKKTFKLNGSKWENDSLSEEEKTDKLPENYDDLFYFLLQKEIKISEFEIKEKDKQKLKSKLIDRTKKNIPKFIFYHIYNSMNEKVQWNNFYFPMLVYFLLYKKSRKILLEINRYENITHINKQEIIKSYNKLYLKDTKYKHNWMLSPALAYQNYHNKLKKRAGNTKNSFDLNYEFNSKGIMPSTDVIVKTNNNGEGKTLLFIGNLLNVYVEDYINTNKDDRIISMEGQDLRSKNCARKQVIYAYNRKYDSRSKEKKMKYYLTKEKMLDYSESLDKKFERIKNKKKMKNNDLNNFIKNEKTLLKICNTSRGRSPEMNFLNKEKQIDMVNLNKKNIKINLTENKSYKSPIKVKDNIIIPKINRNDESAFSKKYNRLSSKRIEYYPNIKNINSKRNIKFKLLTYNKSEIKNNTHMIMEEKNEISNNQKRISNYFLNFNSDFYY